jgi:hypothetical protein
MQQPLTILTKTGGSVPPRRAGARGWLRRHLRVEDALLFGWLVIVEPLLFRSQPGTATSGPDPLLGLLDLIGLFAFIACLAARSRPGVVSGLLARGDVLYAVGPLAGALAFTIDDTGEKLGMAGDFSLVLVGCAIVTIVLVRRLVPPLSADQRRALVTPFILVTSRFFGEFMSGLADIFDVRQLAAGVTGPSDLPGAAFLVTIGTVGALIFYVMLVFAPRQIADREGTALTWTIRFALYIVSLTVGATIGGFLRPS